MLPPANFHRGGGRRDEAVSKDEIQGTLADVLDIIVQGDIGEHQLQLMSYQPAARAGPWLALFSMERTVDLSKSAYQACFP